MKPNEWDVKVTETTVWHQGKQQTFTDRKVADAEVKKIIDRVEALRKARKR